MKVMISQPMRGKTNEQIREEREGLIQELEHEGYECVDTILDNVPEEIKNGIEGENEAIYMLGKSIQFIAEVDAVIFMQGWEKARGCKIEYEVAKEYGKFIKIL